MENIQPQTNNTSQIQQQQQEQVPNEPHKKQLTQKQQETKHKKKQEKKEATNYCKTMKSHLMVTIFNEKTRKENEMYREQKMPNGAAIYCSPLPVTASIPLGENLMVLEMNNDTNKIIAVGIVQNRPHIEKYSVYKDVNDSYNRFVYMGKYRIRREDMTPEEERIMKVFDSLCFKGNYHMKRGQGIRSFPAVVLWRCRSIINLVDFVEKMFRTRVNKSPKV
jgi:hypothetical protein